MQASEVFNRGREGSARAALESRAKVGQADADKLLAAASTIRVFTFVVPLCSSKPTNDRFDILANGQMNWPRYALVAPPSFVRPEEGDNLRRRSVFAWSWKRHFRFRTCA